MTTEEKLKVINRWTYAFDICQSPSGGYYGKVVFSALSIRIYTTWNHNKHDAVIREAFNMVSRNMLKIVRQCK